MEVDPSFAEKLMSTFYMGGGMSEEDEKRCEKIWSNHNNNRSEVLNVVVELCGDVDTPQARYIRALAYSFNSVSYSEQRIDAINNYLNNKLYKKAYENYGVAIEKGVKYGEKLHITVMLQYMADAYCHLKMYDKEEETYLKIYDYKIISPNGCVKLAKFYSKRGQIEKAIDLLKKEKKTLTYILHKEYREPINKYLEELEKKQVGIKKHEFMGYDCSPGFYYGSIYNPIYTKELSDKVENIRNKYSSLFEHHRNFLEQIDLCEAKIKVDENTEKYKELFNTYCLSDINLYSRLMKYYEEINSLGAVNKIEYMDNRNPDYPIFRKLISFYEKEGNIEDAIKLCDIAMEYGIKKYLGKITILEKKEKLLKLLNKQKVG